MSDIINYLFQQYSTYSQLDVGLEIFAVIFGFFSVWFSKNNNVLVFPTGLVSIYGWYYWTRKNNNEYTPITKLNISDKKIMLLIAFLSCLFVSLMYTYFDKWSGVVSYVDILTTSIFFVGMWLMAKRKIESWIYWIIGDIISVPLYLYKGLAFTSFQYFIFTFIAIAGYYKWKSIYNRKNQIA